MTPEEDREALAWELRNKGMLYIREGRKLADIALAAGFRRSAIQEALDIIETRDGLDDDATFLELRKVLTDG